MRCSWFIALLFPLSCFGQKAQVFYNILSHDKDSFGLVEIRTSGYRLISPLLDCYPVSTPGLHTLDILNARLRDYIDTVKAAGITDQVSVYYRDLSNGPLLGIGEEELYSPASLLKVPILIAILKYAQTQPGFLLNQVNYIEPANVPQDVSEGEFIVPGHTYTIRQLLEYMIIYSDNEAKNILSQVLPKGALNQIYTDLGVDVNKNTQTDDFISVKEYAGFFRILYNASYLNRDASDFALSLLARSAYKKGIVAGLPEGIPVAHKFGERALIYKAKYRQLHDCGIVYLDDHPYLLCIMTRGTEFVYLQDVIAHISHIVYEVLKTGS